MKISEQPDYSDIVTHCSLAITLMLLKICILYEIKIHFTNLPYSLYNNPSSNHKLHFFQREVASMSVTAQIATHCN